MPILLLFVSDFKKALVDQADCVCKMGGYHYIISNFKEGGTSDNHGVNCCLHLSMRKGSSTEEERKFCDKE